VVTVDDFQLDARRTRIGNDVIEVNESMLSHIDQDLKLDLRKALVVVIVVISYRTNPN
jgi:hypothetical protein